MTAQILQPKKRRPWRACLYQSLRILIFAGIVLLIHLSARERQQKTLAQNVNREVQAAFAKQTNGLRLGEPNTETGLMPVLNENDEVVKYLGTTSPAADHIIGFSGPTNVLVAFDLDMKATGIEVIWSRDTKEHLEQVLESENFWQQFLGLSWSDLAAKRDVDAVSGATLTSLAIGESLIHRFGGEVPSLRFPDAITIEQVQEIYPEATEIKSSPLDHRAWDVFDKNQQPIGFLLESSPTADDIVGYQGPTRTLIALRADGTAQRIHVVESYDNQPYVSYLNEDWSWPELFNDLSLQQMADYDLEANGIEGVSGATFTSMAVANGVIKRAQHALEPKVVNEPPASWKPRSRDWGTLAVILTGVVISLTHFRGVTWLRIVYQLVLISYVGFVNGDLLSQAMLVGWAENGIPWKSATSLVVLAAVAFVLPVATKRNVYCSHLCPFGAAQQLTRNRLKFQWHPHKNIQRFLSLIQVGLLIWVVIVATAGLSCSLVDIEPFDAFLFQIAGWSAITIAIVGIVTSLFLPMAYCRYGCPTGAMLEFFRRTGRSDELQVKDGVAVTLLILAVTILIL